MPCAYSAGWNLHATPPPSLPQIQSDGLTSLTIVFTVGQSYINCTFTGNVSADCLELDTNGDKELTVADDM